MGCGRRNDGTGATELVHGRGRLFQDPSETEMEAMSRAAPMRSYAAGELLHTPLQQVEALFILKQGRVRVFRLSVDGRALTTAVLSRDDLRGDGRGGSADV